jgi:hypothetical protein
MPVRLLTADTAKACHRGWCGFNGDSVGCGWGGYYGGGYCGRGYYSGGWGYCTNNYPSVNAGGVYIVPSDGYLSVAPAAITLVVNLPADTILTVDGARTTSTSSEREARVNQSSQEKVIKQR